MTSPFQATPQKGQVPNRDLTFTTLGGDAFTAPQNLPGLCHRWHIINSTPGELVTLSFPDESRTIRRLAGQAGIVSRGFSRLAVATATPQTFIVSCGDEDEIDSRAELPGGGATIQTINNVDAQTVVGPTTYNTTDTINNFGPPVAGEMLRDNHDTSFTSFPLQTIDGQSLVVQPGLNKTLGYVVGCPVPAPGIPTVDDQCLRIHVDTADASTGAQFQDQYGLPLALYPADGSAVIDTGTLPTTAAGKTYYAALPGVTAVQVAGPGTWSFHFGFGPQVFIPRLG